MTTLKFAVEGMTCGGCANGVRATLSQQFGVDKDRVEVSHTDGSAQVSLDGAPAPEQLESALAALQKKGYPGRVVE